jgi:hypothetical protein
LGVTDDLDCVVENRKFGVAEGVDTEYVLACAASHQVPAGATVNGVGAATTIEYVAADAALEHVGASATK